MKQGTLIVLAVVFGIALLIGGSWAFRYYTAEIRGAVDAEEQITRGASRISRYEEFYNRCASIQGHESALAAQEARLASITDQSSGEASRVRANIAGIRAQRDREIHRYNTDSANSYSRGRFRASNLPYQLNVNASNTVCIVN